MVDPPESAAIGERVMFPGYSDEPDDVLNLKKKVWEMLQPDLHTNTELMDWIGSVDFVVLLYCVSVNFWNFNCTVAALSLRLDWMWNFWF